MTEKITKAILEGERNSEAFMEGVFMGIVIITTGITFILMGIIIKAFFGVFS